MSQHARYSEEVVRVMSEQAGGQVHLVSDVLRSGGAHWSGYQGSSVSSSWAGLGSSLREVLVLGVLGAGHVSMPVCGTHPPDDDPDLDTDLLCLRWLQLASWMPGMRSWHQDRDNTRMPYTLPRQYQEYSRWALETRYRLLPYLRTLQLHWSDTSRPMVTPMFAQYPMLWSVSWSQFMLGSDLVIGAVTSGDQQLVEMSLATGSWYEFYSGAEYYSPSPAQTLSVPTRLYQLPVFVRGGTVLVTYETVAGASNMLDYTAGAMLELRIALECQPGPRSLSDTGHRSDSGQLSTCEAESSHDWIVHVGDSAETEVKVGVSVTSVVETSGSIMISVTGSTHKTLNTVSITGLALASSSVFTLPGGSEAAMCQDGDSVCWSQQQSVVILKTGDINLEPGNVEILWTY